MAPGIVVERTAVLPWRHGIVTQILYKRFKVAPPKARPS
jgi:hypothetical protein